MKVCSKCHIEKDESEFRKINTGKDGLLSWCKECSKMAVEDYYKKNPDKKKEASKNWRDNNKERISKYKKEYRRLNPNKKYKANPVKKKEYTRWYFKINKNKVLALQCKSAKRATAALAESYLKAQLKIGGYTDEEIKEMPFLLDKKKLDIIIHRSSKLIRQFKNNKS